MVMCSKPSPQTSTPTDVARDTLVVPKPSGGPVFLPVRGLSAYARTLLAE